MRCFTETTNAELEHAGQIGLMLELESTAGLGNACQCDHFLIVWKLTSEDPNSTVIFIGAPLNAGCP